MAIPWSWPSKIAFATCRLVTIIPIITQFWPNTPSSHRHFYTFDLPQSVRPLKSNVRTPMKTLHPIQPRHTPHLPDLKVRFLKSAIKRCQNYLSCSQLSKDFRENLENPPGIFLLKFPKSESTPSISRTSRAWCTCVDNTLVTYQTPPYACT